ISLVSAQARREHARAELAAAGVPFRFLDAMDGDAATADRGLPIDRLRYRIVSRREPVPGEIGCYASHREAWRRCAELGEPVLVLEDDFSLSPRFKAALPTVEELTRKFGFVRLESLYRPPRRASLRPRVPVHRITERNGLTLHYVADVPTSMIGYAIAPFAAASLYAASAPLAAPVDRFVQRTWLHGVPVFGLEPTLIGPGPVAACSTIGARPRSRNPFVMALRVLDSVQGQVRRRRFNRLQLSRLRPGGVDAGAGRGAAGSEAGGAGIALPSLDAAARPRMIAPAVSKRPPQRRL
ncbi:MAG: glycosyltransferase family 25 protein, partial [Gammaproteobacteria bacterium]|nr:glycosyltransferase family 25 protein [Gammaproteobacteria bacterium]